MTNKDLVQKAASVLKRHTNGDRIFGDVGAALISESGQVFTGVCVDTPSWGLCAERSAIAAMITAGEYKINKIVAVWKDEQGNNLTVLPPCGICREFMCNVDETNLETDVVLGKDETMKLKDLLPKHEWPQPYES
jgi:cytidine deaminase